MRVVVCDNILEIARRAAQELLQSSQMAVLQNRRCHVALSGGSTPKYLFEELVRVARGDDEVLKLLQNVDWFFSDERFVLHSDPQSNFKLAADFLFSKINIDEQAIFAVPTQNIDPQHAAQIYEEKIREVVKTKLNDIPALDLIFLGMGDDGHTASLFPKTELVERIILNPASSASLVESVWVPKAHAFRITFMPDLINHAAKILIMASGEQKAKTLVSVLKGQQNPREFPVQLVRPDAGELIWLVDKVAGQLLES